MLERNAGRTCGGSRDTELANDPDMRSETAIRKVSLSSLLARAAWDNHRRYTDEKGNGAGLE